MRLIDGAIEGALRGASLTQRLLVFARGKELQVKPINVRKLVDGMHNMLRRSIGSAIRIQLDLPQDLWPALADHDQLDTAYEVLLSSATLIDRSITEIAFECGFTSSAHFSTEFRKSFGASPRAFRRSATAWCAPRDA